MINVSLMVFTSLLIVPWTCINLLLSQSTVMHQCANHTILYYDDLNLPKISWSNKNHDTITNNMAFCNYIMDSFQRHAQIDVMYTDVSNIFDRVNHLVLLKSFDESDFSASILLWFGS